ncbi:MAG: hypothetical protein ACUVRC_10720 [Desulfotomaculales bacterium]
MGKEKELLENELPLGAPAVEEAVEETVEACASTDDAYEAKLKELEAKRWAAAARALEAKDGAVRHAGELVKDVRDIVADGLVAHRVVLPFQMACVRTAREVREAVEAVKRGVEMTTESAAALFERVDKGLEEAMERAYRRAGNGVHAAYRHVRDLGAGLRETVALAKNVVVEAAAAGKEKARAAFASVGAAVSRGLLGAARKCGEFLRGVRERCKSAVDRLCRDAMPGEDFQEMMRVAMADPDLYMLRCLVKEKPFTVDPRDAVRASAYGAAVRDGRGESDVQLYQAAKEACRRRLLVDAAEKAGIKAEKLYSNEAELQRAADMVRVGVMAEAVEQSSLPEEKKRQIVNFLLASGKRGKVVAGL